MPQTSITTVSMCEAVGAISLNRACVCRAEASCVTTREEMTLFAKCNPKANSSPSSQMATNPRSKPIKMYCGIATQKPKRSTSGLAPWSNPKANPVSNRAIHLYLKSRMLPCIRYPRKMNSSNATWKGMKIRITIHIMKKLNGWNWNTRLDVSPNPYCAPSRTIVRSPHMAAPKNTRFTSKRFLPVSISVGFL